uniref:F-box domain-containing protein n=1 Tax=Oryza meridionalis TaxID=40149 RepID=A0A0E0CLQ6_9ORYZ
MADNGGHEDAPPNGDHHPPAIVANGDDQAAAVNGGDQAAVANDQVAAENDQAAPANGGDQAAAAANGGEHEEANGDLPNVAGIRAPRELRRVEVDALHQVLLRMPAAEVARCSGVCRRLRDLIATDAFRRGHQRHRSRHPMPLFFYRLDHWAFPDRVRVHLRAVDVAARETHPIIRFSHADADLRSADPRALRLQPLHARWPPLHDDHVIVGFYGHGAIDEREYRVLYHTTRPGCRYWVFSLSFFPDQPPRDIGRPAVLEAVRAVLAEGISPSYEMPPVAVAHRLHWRAQAASRNVLVFDTVAESFGWIPPPNQQEGNQMIPVEGDQLLEINGTLAMTLVSQTTVDVWVLQEGEAWEHHYQISLPLNVLGGYDDEGFVSAAVFAVSQERNVLAQCPAMMLQCDTEGNVLRFYSLAGHLTVLSRYMLQESLLAHAFLPMRQEDAIDGDPPFFQGISITIVVVLPYICARKQQSAE